MLSWRAKFIAVGYGMLGVALGLLIWTAWVDHARVTDLWNLEIRRAQAAAQAPTK